ncbi:MAG: Nif11-like leader peptide family RiPP precursor [Candidatus Nanopelagicales bacterium]|nr:Nif11-like leader peptide family RiPP precursor [Candidatus Nanopelagicales bacterium]MDZ7578134.1 Nif11-like leader peptide family RiPP precursor [Candidatus Nanopelagicales bacterium]
MTDQIAALMDAAASDEALKAKLTAAKSIDEIVAVAAANGFTLTSDDVVAALDAEREVSDAELEGAAGGAKSGLGAYAICSAGFQPELLPPACR